MMNGITILMDKSAFQMLTKEEVFACSACFSPVICQLLPLEILADLFKDSSSKSPSTLRQSHSLWGLHGIYNVSSKDLIKRSLQGSNPSNLGFPLPDNLDEYVDGHGVKGAFVGQHPIQMTLAYWESGAFLQAEKDFAVQWRQIFSEENENLLQKIVSDQRIVIEYVKEKSNISRIVDSLANKQSLKNIWIHFLLEYSQCSPLERQQASLFFRHYDSLPLRVSAPYAHYVLRLHLAQLILLKSRHMSAQPTHGLDLIYLEHCPFARMFVSNDRYHKRMFETNVMPETLFISGSDFKGELTSIHENRTFIHGSGYNVNTFRNESIRKLVRQMFRQGPKSKQTSSNSESIEVIRERLREPSMKAELDEQVFHKTRKEALDSESNNTNWQ